MVSNKKLKDKQKRGDVFMSIYKTINIYRNDYDLENYLTAEMQQTAIQNATKSLTNILACSKKADIISKAIGICYASVYIFAKDFAIHGYEIHENIRRSQKSRYDGPNATIDTENIQTMETILQNTPEEMIAQNSWEQLTRALCDIADNHDVIIKDCIKIAQQNEKYIQTITCIPKIVDYKPLQPKAQALIDNHLIKQSATEPLYYFLTNTIRSDVAFVRTIDGHFKPSEKYPPRKLKDKEQVAQLLRTFWI